ncbi:MAG TPA: hypothetical protein VL688_01830 [Verrucomicrobiae bacterium]|nr:hypothetical protein [Verrucomicrobiae bacterium]
MKKIAWILVLSFIFSVPAQAYDSGRTDRGVFSRILAVEGRGALNIVGMPMELVRTPILESKNHHRMWPVTFWPRLITNIITRAASGIYDIVAAPFVLPFTDDITPFTDPMGLSDYPWQWDDAAF